MHTEELRHIVEDAIARVGPFEAGDAVVDIGARDGALLACYPAHDPHVLRVAFERATHVQATLHDHAQLVVAAPFPHYYAMVKGLEGRVKIVTTIGVEQTIDRFFLTALAALLHEDGVWIVQSPGWSLRTFRTLLQGFGLDVVDATIVPAGLRLVVQHKGHPVSEHVPQLLQREGYGVHA